MHVVLVDSSIWISAERSGLLVDDLIPEDEAVAICPSIAQEVLRGTHSPAHYAFTRAALMRVVMLDALVPFARYEAAAQVYLRCRNAAITPRSSVDCLVVACAIAHDVPLFHDDRDFDLIARVEPLKIFNRPSA